MGNGRRSSEGEDRGVPSLPSPKHSKMRLCALHLGVLAPVPDRSVVESQGHSFARGGEEGPFIFGQALFQILKVYDRQRFNSR